MAAVSKWTPTSSSCLTVASTNHKYSTIHSLSRTLSFRTPHPPNSVVAAALRQHSNRTYFPAPESNHKSSVNKFLDSCFVLCTSLALSVSVFVIDVDSAAAFVLATPRKLQTDELATVRLFQDNTPSVVNVTNLAIRYFN